MTIDSLISDAFRLETVKSWADYKPMINCPQNSHESEDEFDLYESTESEDPNGVPHLTKKKME